MSFSAVSPVCISERGFSPFFLFYQKRCSSFLSSGQSSAESFFFLSFLNLHLLFLSLASPTSSETCLVLCMSHSTKEHSCPVILQSPVVTVFVPPSLIPGFLDASSASPIPFSTLCSSVLKSFKAGLPWWRSG